MATHGEYIDPTLLPTSISITDGVNTITYDPTVATRSRKNDFPGTKGIGRMRFYVSESIVKNADTNMPVLNSGNNLTVTVTAASGSTVHFRVGPKNPTWKAIDVSTGSLASQSTKIMDSLTKKYVTPFSIDHAVPGNTTVVLRFRAYKTAVSPKTNNIMPNWKSPLVIIKLIVKDPLP